MNRPFAEVLGNRIFVYPSFAELLKVAAIPEGRWDGARTGWSFPATERHAEIIHGRIRKLTTTDAFEALLHRPSTEVAPTPAPAPAAEQPELLPEFLPVEAPPQEILIELPPGLNKPPWAHQKLAYRFGIDKFAAGYYGILLAMGMGTGKSLVAIMLMLFLHAMRVLVLAPLRVVQVWLTQLERHVGIQYVAIALDEEVGSVANKRKLAEEKMRLAAAMGVPFIAIINYDSAWREPFASWAEKISWDLVIADEAHRLKSPGGKASIFCKRLRPHARHRLALTGTPLPHSLLDAYGPFRFLDVSIFGTSFSAFRQNYCLMGGYQHKQIVGFRNVEDFERRMAKITFRVGKEVLDLPSETHVTYFCELGPEAWRVYKHLEEDMVARVLDGTITATNALVVLLRLEQITGGCVPTDDGVIRRIDNAKLRLLTDTLEDIGKDEAVVVFCRFHADLDAVHEACEANGFPSLELSGRRDDLKRWQDGEGQVLAVQISSGGVGVDLTRARFSMYYSLSFSLGEYDQSLSRVHRPGQTRPVEHIHLVARGTIDQRIMRALEKRAEVIESILAEIKH